jgi:hypothetical protein
MPDDGRAGPRRRTPHEQDLNRSSRLGPDDLARLLGALPVAIEHVQCHVGALALPDYPGEPRPTTIVALSGDGLVGHGEHVGFTRAAHAAFVNHLAAVLPPGAGSVSAITARLAAIDDPFGRAAIEAALVDLALQQAGRSLADLCGVAGELPFRHVVSFAARADAAAHARTLQAAGHRELKIDVDPSWSDAQVSELAQTTGIAVLDFKEQGDADLATRLARACPSALFEDPPSAAGPLPHTSRDRPLLNLGDVEAAARRGEAVNLKAPRMGGPLAVLAALGIAGRYGVAAYIGGMFEVGPGRQQARQLAALFCPGGPNDLAPITGALGSAPAVVGAAISCAAPGFGQRLAWGAALEAAGAGSDR